MKKQISQETEEGKAFIPRYGGISKITCKSDEIGNPGSAEKSKAEENLDTIEIVNATETCQGQLEGIESHGENGHDEILSQTFWSRLMIRLTSLKEYAVKKFCQFTLLMVHFKNSITQKTKQSLAYLSKKAKQVETWISITYIISLVAVVGVNSYFHYNISSKYAQPT